MNEIIYLIILCKFVKSPIMMKRHFLPFVLMNNVRIEQQFAFIAIKRDISITRRSQSKPF